MMIHYLRNKASLYGRRRISNLASLLYSEIKARGPLPVGDFIQLANAHPSLGYYGAHGRIGSKGDFCTAPEFSQFFGEILTIAILINLPQFSQSKWNIVELGPGNGTLIVDVLRALDCLSKRKFVERLFLIERSDRLCKQQSSQIQRYFPDTNVQWYPTFEELLLKKQNSNPTIYLANEFFDALPILIFHRSQEEEPWREVLIDFREEGARELYFTRSPVETLNCILYQKILEEHSGTGFVEISPESERITSEISKDIAKVGGLLSIIDYGCLSTPKFIKQPTLRAIFQQRILPSPFEELGQADLSADVNFERLKLQTETAGLTVVNYSEQREFLLQYGIEQRLKALLKQPQTAQIREHLIKGAEILVDPHRMGSIYKVLMAQSHRHQHGN